MKHMRSRGGGITIYSSLNRFALGGYAIVRRLYTSDMLSPYANLGDEQSQSRLGASGYPTNDVAMQITSQATQQPGKGGNAKWRPGFSSNRSPRHNWDGCIERITQLDAWPDFHRGHQPESGSLTGRLYVRNARDSARILSAAAKIFMCQERTLRRGTKALAVGAARW